MTLIGKTINRLDALDKVTGQAIYAADINFPNMLWGEVLYSQYAYAELKSVDAAEAKTIPGVTILTANDLPAKKDWFGFQPLAVNKVRFCGDVVAIAAAEDQETARKALAGVKVEYNPLKGVFTPEEALAEDAPILHESRKNNIVPNSHYKVRKGDTTKAFKEADIVLEREYRTGLIEHSYLEPEAVVVLPKGPDGIITIYTCCQYPFSTRKAVSEILGMPFTKVRVIQTTVGGTFGGKEEVIGLLAARAALLAEAAGRPVKMVNSREDSFLQSSKRHPFTMKYRIGLKQDGTILALEAELIDDGGAYNARLKNMNWRASVHATGPYNIENVKVDVYGVHTNNVYGGAMRGYSSPQTIFANESLIDEAAQVLNMDPVEFRLKNCFKDRSITATGQVLKNKVPLTKTILRVQEELKKLQEQNETAALAENNFKYGYGLACCFRGCGLGAEYADATGAIITIQRDGSIYIASSLSEVGQGLKTVCAQIAAETLGVGIERITFLDTDTLFVQDGGSTVASRGTYIGGNAVLDGAKQLSATLITTAAGILGCEFEDVVVKDEIYSAKGLSGSDPELSITFEELILECAKQGKNLQAVGWYNPGQVHIDPDTGEGNAYPDYSFGCVGASVKVDLNTGRVYVLDIVADHDVGKAINPECIRGQVNGGVAMGVGFALMENFRTQEGRPLDHNFESYLIPTSLDVPTVKMILVEDGESDGPFYAKSLGEPATEMVGAAVARAVANAIDVNINSLPLSPEKIMGSLNNVS